MSNHKRTFTPPGFLYSTVMVIVRWPRLLLALIKPATSRQLREEIMLACTSVNHCRYCVWLHTTLALKNGANVEELNQFLATGDDALVPKDKAVALLFSQHFAEQRTRPSAEAKQRLAEEFTYWQRTEIIAYLHAIYFGNLGGNTFDAFLNRLKGNRVAGSWLITELCVVVIGLPILLPIMFFARKGKKLKFAGLSE